MSDVGKYNLVGYLLIYFLTVNIFMAPGSMLLKSIEKTDIDKPFYTHDMQELLQNKDSTLQWNTFRVFVPFVSIFVAWLFNTDYSIAMQTISFISGILTILFLYFFFYKLLLSSRPTTIEIEQKRNILVILYITSASVIQFSGTYYIDTFTTLLAFIMVYLVHKAFIDESTYHYILLTLVYTIAIMSKETGLMYLGIMLAYVLYAKKKMNITDYLNFLPLVIVGVCVYYLQYVVWFDRVQHLIIQSQWTEEYVTKFTGFIGVTMAHWVNMATKLGKFVDHRWLLVLFAFGFSYSWVCWHILKAYFSEFAKNWKKFLFINAIVLGLVLVWSIKTTAPKFIYYLTAPLFYVILAKNNSNIFRWEFKRTTIIMWLTMVMLLLSYIYMHNTDQFYRLLEIGT